jgi:hypothetical protein
MGLARYAAQPENVKEKTVLKPLAEAPIWGNNTEVVLKGRVSWHKVWTNGETL